MSWWRTMLGLPAEDVKDIEPWRASQHDQDNFTTNRITVSDYMDSHTTRSDVGLAATWACVNLIAGTIGSLSLEVYRKEGKVRVPDASHPLYALLHDDPNFDLTALDFWEYQAAAIELYGNAYAAIRRGAGGRIIALDIVPPLAMRVDKLPGGRLEYSWSEDGKAHVTDESGVLHIRGPMATAAGGLSVLQACAGVFSGARSADRAANKMFGNGAMPSGVLSTDKALTGPQRTEAEAALQEKFVGAHNAGRPMLLDNGLKWEQLSITPEDAQMLDSRKFSGEEICRIFGVPPAMVGYGDKASNWGTGKEVDVLGFQKFTLRRRLKRIEKSLEKQLLSARDRLQGYKIGFNFEDILRADSQGRAQFYNIMIRLGLMTRNEARALEGLPPIAGGDVITVQMQDVPLSEATQRTNDDED